MFLIMILLLNANDLIFMPTLYFIHADDTKLFSTNPIDLQNNLCTVESFLKNRQLSLASSKRLYLSIKHKRSIQNNQYFISNNVISTCTSVKDLDVSISNDLKWSFHIAQIRGVASICSYRILKCFSSRNIWTLRKAFVTYVRPKLEYNTPVWSPYFYKDIIAVESIQKNFTRRECMRYNIPFTSYSDRLIKLNLKSLEYRHLEFDLIMVYQICYELVDIPINNCFEFVDTNTHY